MSKNCLVKKLKGNVSSSLPLFNIVKFKVTPNSDYGVSGRKALLNYIDAAGIQQTLTEGRHWKITLEGGDAQFSNILNKPSVSVLTSDYIPQDQVNPIHITAVEGQEVTVIVENKYEVPTINGDFSDFPEYDVNTAFEYFTGTIARGAASSFTDQVFNGFKGDASSIVRFIVPNIAPISSSITNKLTNINLVFQAQITDGDAIPETALNYSGRVMKWSRGSRVNSSLLYLGDGVRMFDTDSVTNFLLDYATCTNINNRSNLGLRINIEAYTPTTEALNAINTLKELGVTPLVIANVTY